MNERIKLWLIKAFEDWKVLKNEIKLTDEEISTSAVCFHAQQFVEKSLKAYLTMKEIPFPSTHDIVFLLNLCKKVDKGFEKIEFVEHLNKYAVKVRYVDDFFIPSAEEAKNCYRLAKSIKDFILNKLNVEEKEILKWLAEKRGEK